MSTLQLSNSPVKPYNKGDSPKQEDTKISIARQSIDQILLDDKIREEIDAKAAILAQQISKDKSDARVKELNEKIEELEQ